MIKKILTKKTIVISSICAVLIGCVGIAGAYNLSKSEKRIAYENLIKEANKQQEEINAMGEPKNQQESEEKTKKSLDLKQKGIEIYNLGKEVKTQEEFAQELKKSLEGTKLGLEDTKFFNKTKKDKKTQLFVEKMEAKVARIEKDFAENKKTPEELLKELYDKSDIDN